MEKQEKELRSGCKDPLGHMHCIYRVCVASASSLSRILLSRLPSVSRRDFFVSRELSLGSVMNLISFSPGVLVLELELP